MIIAIDVGGTKISAALISNEKKTDFEAVDYKIIEQRKMPSVIHSDLSNLSKYLIELCHDWLERASHVAIACTGQVGDELVNFLSAKQRLPLKAQLKVAFNLPITIINDAAAAAWAEYRARQSNQRKPIKTIETDGIISSDKRDDTLVYITVSTGIGGGMIQNGQLVTSADGFCAHLGHVSVQHANQQSIQCHCGRINCAETIASGTAIATQASKILNKPVSCKEVFEQYLEVEEIASLIDDASSAVTDLIANIKAVTGTTTIILGGSVGASALFHQQVVTKTSSLPAIYQADIELPKMGANADLIGAFLYAKKNEQYY